MLNHYMEDKCNSSNADFVNPIDKLRNGTGFTSTTSRPNHSRGALSPGFHPARSGTRHTSRRGNPTEQSQSTSKAEKNNSRDITKKDYATALRPLGISMVKSISKLTTRVANAMEK